MSDEDLAKGLKKHWNEKLRKLYPEYTYTKTGKHEMSKLHDIAEIFVSGISKNPRLVNLFA